MGAIREVGRLSFEVTSETRKGITHLVDIEAFRGHGECSCEHFQIRILPKIEKAIQEKCFTRFDNKLMCKHLWQARNALLNRILMRQMK